MFFTTRFFHSQLQMQGKTQQCALTHSQTVMKKRGLVSMLTFLWFYVKDADALSGWEFVFHPTLRQEEVIQFLCSTVWMQWLTVLVSQLKTNDRPLQWFILLFSAVIRLIMAEAFITSFTNGEEKRQHLIVDLTLLQHEGLYGIKLFPNL